MIYLNKLNIMLSVLLTMRDSVYADNIENKKMPLRGIVKSPLLSLKPNLSSNDEQEPHQQRKLRRQQDDFVEFFFDCHVNGMVGTMTNDKVTAYFYDSAGNVIDSKDSGNSGIRCFSNNPFSFEIRTSEEVEFVRLAIEGEGDALFIDRAWLDVNGNTVEEWDVNDDQGWCLSWESDDVDDMSWEDNSHWDQCRYQICFKPNDVVEGGYGCEDVPNDVLHQQFGFDCYVPNAANLGTNDLVMLSFYDAGGDAIDTQYVNDGVSCQSNSGHVFDVHSERQIDSIMMMLITPSESGDESDALFIDRAWLDVDGSRVDRWDWNGSWGYCLSNESDDDIVSGWNNNWSQCYPVICFQPNNNVAHDACFIP